MQDFHDIQLPAPGRKRGRYSKAFKAEFVAACTAPGISIPAVALANGINANLLRRWISEYRKDQDSLTDTPSPTGFIELASPARATEIGAAAGVTD